MGSHGISCFQGGAGTFLFAEAHWEWICVCHLSSSSDFEDLLRQKQESWTLREQLTSKHLTWKQKTGNNQINYCTLSETNNSPLKMDGWNTTFLLRCHIFRGELLVSGRKVFKWICLVSWGAIRWLAVSLQQQIHAHDHREGFRDCRCCHIQWISAWWNNKLATIVV